MPEPGLPRTDDPKRVTCSACRRALDTVGEAKL